MFNMARFQERVIPDDGFQPGGMLRFLLLSAWRTHGRRKVSTWCTCIYMQSTTSRLVHTQSPVSRP
jgi:hypothetical protein